MEYIGQTEYRKDGDVCWFEYHCFESIVSQDYQLWLHSHQQVEIIKIETYGNGLTKVERGENGEPACYLVKFNDGYIYTVFEDELLDNITEFYRPEPPKTNQS